jgi:sugar (pentulose or hexulose) kinase
MDAQSGARILAIDAGTQSVRAALVDLAGGIHHAVKTSIEPYFSAQPGWAELDPERYFDHLCDTVRQVMAQAGDERARIVAVSLTTQRATVVNVDRDGAPLRPAIVWLDQRKADGRKAIPRAAVPLLKLAGVHPIVDFATQFCRSSWIQQNQPEIWAKTHKYLFLSGFLTHRLTGELVDCAANVIGPLPFDTKRWAWAGPRDPKWRLFPIEREKLPSLVRPGELLGKVTAKASDRTGIPAGLPVIAAGNDKGCDVIGAGCLAPAQGCISFGTTATFNTQNDHYVELRPFLPPYPSAIPGAWYSEVAVVRGLWMVSWFKEEFGLQERMLAKDAQVSPEELLERLVRDVPPGCLGLVCQPFWSPSPEHAPSTRGALIGFGAAHGRAHVYRAILEGLVFALQEGAQRTAKRNRVALTEIRATGGGSKSDALMQITADVFGLPVHRPHTPETSMVGAAMDAAVGLGLHAGFTEAARAMTHVARTFEPDPAHQRLYRALHERVYRKMYGALSPLYDELRAITGYPE